jgi:alkylation response protein AidB-like acyl-CoA dehydrogenase
VVVNLSAIGQLDPALDDLRLRVRGFLAAEIGAGAIHCAADAWMSGIDTAFSQRLARRGWVGMTIPAAYGGGGRSALERYVVNEELLAAGAPVAAHWIADRQMAPSILRNGTDEQKRAYLPAIARAEAFFAIGMSEPDSGSDLASIRTRARQAPDGWRLSGTKLWTSGAHIATAMVVLARTDDAGGDRHQGLSQFIVDLPHPDVRISPIITIDGAHHFNEVVFDDALIPATALLGRRGEGWRQVTAELGNERSGPERILSTMPLFAAWAAQAGDDPVARADLGRLTSRLVALREMSLAVAAELDRGGNPEVEAALVKDLGTVFEGEVVDVVRRHAGALAGGDGPGPLAALADQAALHVPAFTLRGGTSEVLRSIVAKGLLEPRDAHGAWANERGTPATSEEGRRRAQGAPQASGGQGMSEHAEELAAAVGGLLKDRQPAGSAAPDGLDAALWRDLAALGFTGLTVPEHLGGSSGDLRDAAVVVVEAARFGAAVPVAEALFLAGPLLAAAGVELPGGVVTSAVGTLTAARDGRVSGRLEETAWIRSAEWVVCLADTTDGTAVAVLAVPASGLSAAPGGNLAGEPRGTVVLDGVIPARLAPLPPGDWARRIELHGAVARSAQIGGAARAVLDLTVAHARQRIQFGRPLAKFQAIQQMLARLAADTATVTVAADAAVRELLVDPDAPGTELMAASAKAQASGLATGIAAAGHQVHGAIGFTMEHRLGAATKRLWSWRQEFGNELYWYRRIGALAAGSRDGLWPLVTGAGIR